MRTSWLSLGASAILGAAAFASIVAHPSSGFVSAITFSFGVALVTFAFTELVRAISAWFSHRETLRWIGGGVVIGIGLFAAGASFIVHTENLAFDWIALAGVFAAVGGVRLQLRAR